MKKNLSLLAFAASLYSLTLAGCGVSHSTSSQSFEIPAPTYAAGKVVPISEKLKMKLAALNGKIVVSEVVGGPKGIDAYGIYDDSRYTNCGGYYCYAAENVTALYLSNNQILTELAGPVGMISVGSYTDIGNGKIQIDEICTGAYGSVCNVGYDKKSGAVSINKL